MRELAMRRLKPAPPKASWATRVLRWLAVSRQRRDLLRLSDAQLDDIGLTRADVEREAQRAFWDNG